MFSRILAAPLLILAIGFLYLTWEVDPSYSWYIIPCVVLLAVIYILSPQIEWWWGQRNPPELDAKVLRLLQQRLPYYQRLDAENKALFRKRLALYLLTKDFKPQAFEQVPEDIKAMIAAGAVQVSLGTADFLMEPFDHIVVYPEAFPSPRYPRHRHSSEIFAEDGVLLFSARHIAHGFLEPDKYYPSHLHEYVEVFRLKYEATWPALPDNSWQALERICGFPEQKVREWIGLPEIEVARVAATCFLAYPEGFREVWPELYRTFSEFFRQDPLDPKGTVAV